MSGKNVELVIQGITACLRDTEMPVRLEAAIGLQAMLKDKTGGNGSNLYT